MAPRHDLVSSAVTFLQDPSVASSPVEKRIEFLRSKNLTQEEIDLALAQSGGEGIGPPPPPLNQPYYPSQQYQRQPPGYGYPPGYGQWAQQPPPEPPRRDWRDYFIMATVVGGASYGLYVLAQRYIKPLIAPPTPPQLEQDKAAIDEQFNKAFALLDTLAEDTTKLKEAEQERTKRLDGAIADIETIVADLKSANQRREDDSRRMEAEIKNMRDSLPRAIDTVKEGSEKQLRELSTELSSLKALMQNRAASSASFNIPRAPKPDATPYTPQNVRSPNVGTPTNEIAPGSASNVTGVNGSSTVPSFAVPSGAGPAASNAAASASTSVSAAKPTTTNLGYGAGKVSIPAWQLAAQKNQEKEKAQSNGIQADGADAVAALQSS